MDIYTQNHKKGLSNYKVLDKNVSVSNFDGLSLKEYCNVVKYCCKLYHNSSRCDCESMLEIAHSVLNECIVPLSKVYRKVFPKVTYHSGHAKQRLLRMPLAAVQVEGTLEKMA